MFANKLDYYIDSLKFNSTKAIAGLDDEIEGIKRMIKQTNELRLNRIKSTLEFSRVIMEQPLKI